MSAALLLSACQVVPHHPAVRRPVVQAPPVVVSPPVAPPRRTAADYGLTAGPSVLAPGVSPDAAAAALRSFRESCPGLLRRVDRSGLTRNADWQPVCAAAASWPDGDATTFFARNLEAAQVGDGRTYVTGYYEPEIAGSRDHLAGFDVPIYRKPPDLVEADPGDPQGKPTGRKVRGRIDDGHLVAYYDRAAIDAGALDGQGLEIGWAADPVEVFFLQVQGSGRLIAPDGTVMRIGYAGQNGRDYTGIGKAMRDQGLLGPDQLSMQGVMAWLRANPDAGKRIMETNKSFVFFRELTGDGPIGAMGVPVRGHVSVAADPLFVPLGAPVVLEVDRPGVSGLWVAQDTGGAIKGSNRFDTFWGAGAEARVTAGGMSARGRTWLLLPIGTVARLNGSGGPPARP